MLKWLEVLLPSINPEGRKTYIESMKDLAVYPDTFDFIINDEVTGQREIGRHFEKCYRQVAPGTEWILIGNDDLVMKTPGWDIIFREKCYYYSDQIALYWPNDTIFGSSLACFPLVSMKAMRIADAIWPMPFEIYKVDDTITDIFPEHRRHYLPEIIMKHLNDKGTDGFRTSDGRIYPNIPDVMARDTQRYINLKPIRNKIRMTLSEMVND